MSYPLSSIDLASALVQTPGVGGVYGLFKWCDFDCIFNATNHLHRMKCNGSFPLLDSDSDLDSDTDSCTIQMLWERDPNLNLSQWKDVLHNTM